VLRAALLLREREDLGLKLRGTGHLPAANKGKSGLFDSKSRRYPARDRLLRTSVESGPQLRVQAEAQALIAIHSLEGAAPHLPDLALCTKVKKHLYVMAAVAFQAIHDDKSARLFLQAQPTPMPHGIRQPPISIVISLDRDVFRSMLDVFGLAMRRVAPEKAPPWN
jgi:hypothetical protein